MKKTLKAGFLTICMTALATAPIVTITTLATADAAYAKGGNGNGNAGGKGAGRDKAAEMKLKGKGKGHGKGGKGSAKRGGPKTLGEFFSSLTGQDKKPARTTRTQSSKKTIPATTEAPAKRGAKLVAGLHPSQLGNMNAAYNANMNAILAHIRNGNRNGPIGAMAGLAVATSMSDVSAEEARANRELAEAYDAAAALLAGTEFEGLTSEETVLNYLAAGDQNLPEVNAAIDDIALNKGGDGLQPYPSDEDLASGSDVVEAEDYVVHVWNKSDAANEEDTAALLVALTDRFAEHGTAIDEAIAEAAEREGTNEVTETCEAGDDLCDEEVEEIATID